ncbi:hypothetical protein BDF19DRAFT_313883 [Syncephalis fuscata]|nr:hypothetical protein BDF19DRAFT_313883 [Syncephalis fuscata]
MVRLAYLCILSSFSVFISPTRHKFIHIAIHQPIKTFSADVNRLNKIHYSYLLNYDNRRFIKNPSFIGRVIVVLPRQGV